MAQRHWTRGEQQRLFDDYFGAAAGVCPVCSEEVLMIMSHLGPSVTLLLSCEGCGNKAAVTREAPLQAAPRDAAA